MLVVRRVDIIFNKYTPGRDGCRYKIWYSRSSSGYCLSFVLCLSCVCQCVLCVVVCVHWRVTQGQWQDSAPAAPCNATPPSFSLPSSIPSYPPPPFLWHPPCPHWLDNTQPLYATCPSARLHLREPLSPSSELPLAAFVWILVESPLLPTPLPSFSLTLSCSLLLPVLSFTNTDTQKDTHIQTSDCLCQLFPTSASRHKGPPLPHPTTTTAAATTTAPTPLPAFLSPVARIAATVAVVSDRNAGCWTRYGRLKSAWSRWYFVKSETVRKL